MGEQNFWIEDNDFYTEIVSKVADLSLNTYLLITDLQNDITYVPKTTADFHSLYSAILACASAMMESSWECGYLI